MTSNLDGADEPDTAGLPEEPERPEDLEEAEEPEEPETSEGCEVLEEPEDTAADCADDRAADPDPESASEADLYRIHIVPSGPTAAVAARAVVREMCRKWSLGQDVEDLAVQCVSELASNVFRHVDFSHAMGDSAKLHMAVRLHSLVVEIWDPDPRVPDFDMFADEAAADPVMPGFGSLRESGRGMHIVRALIRSVRGFYGVEPRGVGKAVFFGLPLPDPVPLSAPSAPETLSRRAGRVNQTPPDTEQDSSALTTTRRT